MDVVILIFSIIASVCSAAALISALMLKSQSKADTTEKTLEGLKQQLEDISRDSYRQSAALKEDMSRSISDMSQLLERRLQTFQQQDADALGRVKDEVSKQLELIRADNNQKLETIRTTVDGKLQQTLDSRLSQSFKTVSERLEQVYKGLGEMQNLAGSVGDLKKVLSNVKTRGILGEVQLGAIISEILTPSQYDTEAAVVPGSRNRVEYAVRLPAEGGTIYLPIDSKFPGDSYSAYVNAAESGDKAATEAALKQLKDSLKQSAKDIHDKYICPPYTTQFAVMFLPFEGLYATAVNNGMVEELQHTYNVNIAGPSTLAALLNALQMGFKTLAVQQRSNEVWQILSEVKTEFEKFSDTLDKTRKALSKAGDELDSLVGTRTRAITKRLDKLQKPE